ncbi:hypothetical protein ACLOJK_036830 [Asimina triloba]
MSGKLDVRKLDDLSASLIEVRQQSDSEIVGLHMLKIEQEADITLIRAAEGYIVTLEECHVSLRSLVGHHYSTLEDLKRMERATARAACMMKARLECRESSHISGDVIGPKEIDVSFGTR